MSDISDKALKRILETIKARDAAVGAIEPCTMAQYLEVVSRLPRPTDEQIGRFVDFVSMAHSWYKHLPLLPPGMPFRFFLNPYSGYDCSIGPSGECVHVERTDKSSRFHYTWMTTADYRSRFGHLSYAAGKGPSFAVGSANSVLEYADLPVFSTDHGMHRIPREVAEAGSVELTAIVHPHSSTTWVWTRLLQEWETAHANVSSHSWPTETGGVDTLNQILALVEEEWSPEQQTSMDRLLLPERQRLIDKMKTTISRMLDVVYNE